MSGPQLLAWLLTAVFALLALPCVLRLVRLDYARLGHGLRHADLAELLLVIAMVAMLSPVGGPIPAAGWQAIFVLTAAWFGFAWWRGRRQAHTASCGHHALSAAAMLYMVTAMPHGGMAHGPWLTMSTMETGLAVPLLAIVGAGYFLVDAAWSGVTAVRTRGVAAPGLTSRTVCRAVMGAGMGYVLLAAV
ncbi:DUF5134 domain-containing protein [Amycolatopsis sp. NPDC051903]|uniref:DUF5134 domain-containing protein n=1 Tax=Amycolatopsis sp. NPDC051903 TaxID=3363936 RepID=UPI00378E2936